MLPLSVRHVNLSDACSPCGLQIGIADLQPGEHNFDDGRNRQKSFVFGMLPQIAIFAN